MSFEYTFIFLFFILERTKKFILFEKFIFFTFWKLKMFLQGNAQIISYYAFASKNYKWNASWWYLLSIKYQ